jgi:DNA-binding FadR family transcriptional regulator
LVDQSGLFDAHNKIMTTLQKVEEWLQSSKLSSGDRLPPERVMSQTLGISRSELRKALAILEVNGVLKRHIGRGTFLSGGDEDGSEAATLIARLGAQTSPHEAMMARLALEPELASLAAIHATPQQLRQARMLGDAVRHAKSWDDYERLDAEFHRAIAEAAGNRLLAELHAIMNAVRVSVVWPRLDLPKGGPSPDYHSFAAHDAILSALDARDRKGAHAAMREHILSIRETLLPEL